MALAVTHVELTRLAFPVSVSAQILHQSATYCQVLPIVEHVETAVPLIKSVYQATVYALMVHHCRY